jgi:hypothetical protein
MNDNGQSFRGTPAGVVAAPDRGSSWLESSGSIVQVPVWPPAYLVHLPDGAHHRTALWMNTIALRGSRG